MTRTAARISRASSVGINSRRAMPPGRLPLSGVLARELQLFLDHAALVGPVQALLQIGDRLRRPTAAVERRAEVVERVGVLEVGRVCGPGGDCAPQDRNGP